MTTPTPETIAASLSEAQRKAIASAWFDKWRVLYIPMGRPTTCRKLGALGLTSWDHAIGSYLTQAGEAVRAYLKEQK